MKEEGGLDGFLEKKPYLFFGYRNVFTEGLSSPPPSNLWNLLYNKFTLVRCESILTQLWAK